MSLYNKKLLSLILALIVAITSILPVMASEDSSAIDSVKLEFMQSMDLLWGYDSIIGKEALVQKADIAILLARCLNLDLENYVGEQKFKDVPTEHRAFSAVGLLSDRGIFVGEGNGVFGADSFVNREDLYRVLGSILGYNLPNGSVSLNSAKLRNELMKGVSDLPDKRVTSFQLIEMLYNFLHAPMAEQTGYGTTQTYEITDKTPLEEYFDIYMKNGIVKATETGSLIGEDKAGQGYVKIGDTIYNTCGLSFVDYLGCEVDYYYRWTKGDVRGNLVYFTIGDCEVITFDKADGVYSSGKYTYFVDDNKEETAYIPVDAVVIYNGVQAQFSSELMNPEIGIITLYDSNSDDKYETVHIKEYKARVVASKNSQDMTLSFKYSNEILKLDEDEYDKLTICDTTGKTVDFKNIKTWNVLMIAESLDKRNLEVLVCKDAIKGVVTELNTSGGKSLVTVNGTEYEVSAAYKDESDDRINVGDGGVFRLDSYGKIVTLTKSTSDGLYAYVMGIDESTGLNAKKLIKVFSQDEDEGSVLILSLADNVTIDGKKCNSKGISNGIDYLTQNVKPEEVIIYRTNVNGEVTYIDTAEPNTDGTQYITKNFDTMEYSKNALHFEADTFEGLVNVNSNTLVFALPEDKEKEEKYKATNSTFLVTNNYYSFKAYGDDKLNMFADVIVTEANSASETITDESALLLVGDIRKKLNSDQEEAYFMQIYPTNKFYEVDKECPRFDTVDTGDLVYLGIDSSDVIVDIRVVYDVSEDKFLDHGVREYYGNDNNIGQVYANGSTGCNVAESWGWAPEWKTVVANPYQFEDGFARLTYDSLEDIMQWESMSDDVRAYKLSAARIYCIEKDRGDYKISASSLDAIRDYLHYGDEMSKIALQANWSRVQTVYVYR